MAELTTFKVGGCADILAWPENGDDIELLIKWAMERQTPWMVLGGGANILVSDRGVRGLVIATAAIDSIRKDGTSICAGSGSLISDVSAFAADEGMAGLDFIYSMPGSTGGAVWMNARCYGGEIGEVLEEVEYIDVEDPLPLRRKVLHPRRGDFSYKSSPFQKRKTIILESRYALGVAAPTRLWEKMKEHEEDRRSKGHFSGPCAGSVFKNDRKFGAPSGALLDSIGMKGIRMGGAQVSDQHANIIINNNGAAASDIAGLMDMMQGRAYAKLGCMLEPEIIKVGEWT